MQVVKKVSEVQKIILAEKKAGKTIGFAPTMGALHRGHLSLLQRSLAENGFTVTSIFVNPIQFNDRKDFELYPRNWDRDIKLLEDSGCDVLFLPDEHEVYPDAGFKKIDFNPGYIAEVLEGKYRPGHFDGMAAVVKRLFDIVKPDCAYFGQKDYQQYLIVKKLIHDYAFPIRLVLCPTLREQNGLAMSSRNERLTAEGREKAGLIYHVLQEAENGLKTGVSPMKIKEEAIHRLHDKGNFKVDYFDICSAKDLVPLTKYSAENSIIICTAVYSEGIRLIDNILVGYLTDGSVN